jgi:hypothetical protein
MCIRCEAMAAGGLANVRNDQPLAAPESGELEGSLPRCIAYLSIAGDVITLELTGEPKFTEADVQLVADILSKRRGAPL